MKWNGKGYDETDINLEQLGELIDLLMLVLRSGPKDINEYTKGNN